MKNRIGHYCISFLCTAGGILLDRLTKNWAVFALKGTSAIPVIPDILELTYVENRGAAFGMMQGKQTFFLLLTAVISAAIVYILTRIPLKKRMLPCTACLVAVLAGAIGNLIDRTLQGYVVDFIYFKPIDFPVFNVADIFVTCGMFILMALLVFYYKDEDLSWLEKPKKHTDEGIS